MNVKQASILLEQAIAMLELQSGDGVTAALNRATEARGMLVAFRDGWFARHRRQAAHLPTRPKAPEKLSRVLDPLVWNSKGRVVVAVVRATGEVVDAPPGCCWNCIDGNYFKPDACAAECAGDV